MLSRSAGTAPFVLACAAALASFGQVALANGSDECGDATVLNISEGWAGDTWDTTGFETVSAFGCATGPFGTPAVPDGWYQLTAPANGFLTVDTGTQSYMSVYEGCFGTPLGCAFGIDGNCFPNGNLVVGRLENIPVQAGQVYVIQYGYNQPCNNDEPTTVGPGSINVSFSTGVTPTNDTCATATTATIGQNLFDLYAANVEGLTSCNESGPDVWLSFTAPTPGVYRFRRSGGPASAAVSLFGACGSVPLACPASSQLPISYELTGGQTVLVRVARRPLNIIQSGTIPNFTYTFGNGPGSVQIERLTLQSNDTCDGAITLNVGSNTVDNRQTFYESPTPVCLGGTADTRDGWYSFTPTITSPHTFALTGAPLSTLSLLPACGAAPIACATSGFVIPNARICSVPLTAGTTYFVRYASIGTTSTTAGSAGTLTVQAQVTAPVNDTCAGATLVNAGTTNFDTTGACTNDRSERDVWFRFRNTTGGLRSIVVNTCGSSFATNLTVLTGCDQTATEIAFATSGGCGPTPNGSVRFCLANNATAYICVGGNSGNVNAPHFGAGVLNVTSETPAVNDTCAGALEIALGATPIDFARTCKQGSLPGCAAGQGEFSDQWYRFTPPQTGIASFQLESATTIAALSVHASCTTGAIVCDGGYEDADGNLGLCVPVTAGQQYYLRLISLSGSSTNGEETAELLYDLTTVTYSEPVGAIMETEPCNPLLAQGDDCSSAGVAGARRINPGDIVAGRTALATDGSGAEDTNDAVYFDLAAPSIVTISGQSRLPGMVEVVRAGYDAETDTECTGDLEVVGSVVFTSLCSSDFSFTTATLSPDRYSIVYTPSRLRTCASGDNRWWLQMGAITSCDSIDFNNDGLFPDDADLIDLLSVLAGGGCSNDPACSDIDFNNDGLFPDDTDLVSFLRVLAGGDC